jgi:catechol 2,3-dioxygenase
MPPIPPSGPQRLPPTTRLGAVHLQVSELTRSMEYYRRVLGLVPLRSSEKEASLGAHVEDPPLVHLTMRTGARPVPPRGRLGLFHFALLVPGRRALAEFAAHLAALGVRPGASDHRVSEALYLSDPDGLGIEVYADRPRDQWREARGELAMSTDPLDLAGLIREGSTGPWSGMPRGTAMGHIHLHVGDLLRASDFYHQTLGFDKTVWSYPGALFLSAGGYHHHLGVNTWAASAPPASENDARLLSWELVLPSAEDLGRALDSLEQGGAEVDRETGLARDPWGTPVRLRS